MKFLSELKRRNVFRVAGIYAVVGWILMQVASSLEASLKLPEWFDSVITAGLLIGFPIAILLAWAFEMTPEGVKRTEDESQVSQSVTSNKMDGLILIGIVAVLGMGIWQQFSSKDIDSRLRGNDEVVIGNNGLERGDMDLVSANSNSVIRENLSVIPAQAGISKEEPETILDNTIAVLPFADLSQAGDQEYFSDGIAEEILNVLVRVDALKVTSRTSAFQFKGSKKGIPAIAKELKVRHVLEGSVRKSGETLRITAQLIDAQNDTHLWSEAYDRPLTTENIFAIQDEISGAIVQALKQQLNLSSVEPIQIKHSTENLSAYELFLKARPLFISRQQLNEADELLIQAIELDPKFSDAWAMRAAIAGLNQFYEFRDVTLKEGDALSIQLANHALSFDADNALALSVRAFSQYNANIRLRGQYDVFQIESDLERALEIEPKNTTTLLWLSSVYGDIGKIGDVQKLLEKCIEYEPNYVPCHTNYIYALQFSGKYKTALDGFQKKLSSGLISIEVSPLISIAKANNKLAFLMIMNLPSNFKGWNRNEDLYYAYQNLELDHSLLMQDAIDWIQNKKIKPESWEDILLPFGHRPSREDYGAYDVFSYKAYDMNSKETKKYLKDAGIFAYWKAHGYPPRCKSLGENDFECD